MENDIHWSPLLVTAPACEPITLAEAKLWLRYTASDQDDLIVGLIVAARRHVESHTGRRLITSTWDLKLDRFPWSLCPITLPYAPLSSVTSIKYLDVNGTEQTWASSNYIVDSASEPGRITPAFNACWPVTQCRMNAVTVRYVAGYGARPDQVPAGITVAVRFLISHWFLNREPVAIGTIVASIPDTMNALLEPYRVRSL